MPGVTELLVIAGTLLLLFGGRKIPEFMRGIGKGMREFNNAKNEVKDEINKGISEEEKETKTRTTRKKTTLKGRKPAKQQ